MFGESKLIVRNGLALMCQIVRHRFGETGIGEKMRGIGCLWKIAAGELVWPLSARFHPFQPTGDGEFYRLVVAGFEVKHGVVLDRSPIAAEQRVAADKIERTGDQLSLAPAHDEQD